MRALTCLLLLACSGTPVVIADGCICGEPNGTSTHGQACYCAPDARPGIKGCVWWPCPDPPDPANTACR